MIQSDNFLFNWKRKEGCSQVPRIELSIEDFENEGCILK